MLSIFLLVICNILPHAFAERCPFSSSCNCSSDLTIVTCTNRQLTDQSLINLTEQFPSSTVVLNLSSNAFTSINALANLNNLQTLDLSRNKIRSLPSSLFSKFPQLSSLFLQQNLLRTIPKSFNEVSNIQLDLSNNPLNCLCQSKWLIKWFATINLLNPINCQKGAELHENDFCSNSKDFLSISPQQSQVVYENDPFVLNCSSNTKIYWTFNGETYSTNSTVAIPRLHLNHSGLWACHSLNLNRSIALHVLKIQTNHFCQSIQMDTSKGHFYWPRTLTGQTIHLKCPSGPAAWLTGSSEVPKAYHTCSANRQWSDLDLSQCAFRTNISREFDHLLSTNETNLLSKLVTFLAKRNLDEFKFDDIIFLIDLIDEEQEKYISSKRNIDEICMFIYRLSDYILQMNQNLDILDQYQHALTRLRFILERSLDLANPSWLYVGKQLTAMTLESPLPPTVCFIPNRPLLTLICGILNRQHKRHEPRLATIQFPSASNQSVNQSSVYRIIIFRQSRLFTPDSKSNNNPVIYMKPVSAHNVSMAKLTFYGQSNQASIGIWNANKTSWELKSTTCQIKQQNIDLISIDCVLARNTSISITYLNDVDDTRSVFLKTNYLELSVYVSSIIASACFFVSILFYVCCHRVYLMPRSFFHCLINYWLCLGILFPLFAFGIRQSQYVLLCQFIAISLHYLCLTTILWLTLLTYCIWQKLYVIWTGKGRSDDGNGDPAGKSSVTIVDYDDDGLPIMKLKAKPVIQFYFLAYGISFIICGINVAISRDQYISNKICFLNNFDSLLTILIPISVFVFLLLVFILAARINIKRLTKEAIRLRNLPDESEMEPESNAHNDEHLLSSKPNETVPIIVGFGQENQEQNFAHMDCRQSHLDSLCSSDMDHQHQPSNQLLSILFQLLLLVLIFLSSLSIYLHPLHSYHIRFEHSIYNHLYGVFVLLLAFYILSFYVLSRSDLTLHCKYWNCCSTRNKKRLLNQSYNEPPPPPQTPQQSPTLPARPATAVSKDQDARIFFNQNLSADESYTEQMAAPSPPHSHYSSSIYNCQGPPPPAPPPTGDATASSNAHGYGSKYQATIASKYYARHRHILKTSVSTSETSLQQTDSFPLSTLNTIEQESTNSIDEQQTQRHASNDHLPKKSNHPSTETYSQPNGHVPFHTPSVASPRSYLHPSMLTISPRTQPSPSQAIIRPLPIIRLMSPSIAKPLSSPLHTPSTILTNGHSSPSVEQDTGRNSYRVMPSPTTEERHATFVYLNKNNHLVQQEASSSSSPKEKAAIWKKPVNGHHPHVAYIDEDDEGSVSLKSSACGTSSATSSNTASPVLSRKDRSQTLSSSSSSSSTYSNDFCNGASDTNQIILHESSV